MANAKYRRNLRGGLNRGNYLFDPDYNDRSDPLVNFRKKYRRLKKQRRYLILSSRRELDTNLLIIDFIDDKHAPKTVVAINLKSQEAQHLHINEVNLLNLSNVYHQGKDAKLDEFIDYYQRSKMRRQAS